MANPLSYTTGVSADYGSSDDSTDDGLSETTPPMDVLCGADDAPDTDDGMYITQAALRVLASKAISNSRPHCSSCTCTRLNAPTDA